MTSIRNIHHSSYPSELSAWRSTLKSTLFLLHVLHFAQSHTGTSYLFASDSRGGIMSLSVDTYRTGLTQELANNSLMNLGQFIGELSYDRHSQYVLARQARPERVVYAPVCSDPNSPAAVIFNASTTFPIVDTEYRGSTSDCEECKAGPFALFDNKIYFLVTGDFGIAPLTRSVAQLRVLQSCNDCKLNLDTMNSVKVFKTPSLFNCSRLIAEVFSQPMMLAGHLHLKAGRSIKIIKSEQGLHFFFQLFVAKKQRRQRTFADLLLFQATDSGNVIRMHAEKVDGQYAQWNIHALASVDYKDGLLCWTGADRLYCGLVGAPTWTLHSVQRLLYPGEGAALQICKGNPPDLLVYISGVAIAEAVDIWNKRVIFFGCYPQWKSLGGTGMIKVSLDGEEKHVFAITKEDGRTPLYSGSMFTLDGPLGACHAPGRLDICLEPPIWVNKPGSLLKDKPNADPNTTFAPPTSTECKTVPTTETMHNGKSRKERVNSEMERDENVEVKMQESKMNPDPEIIVVDNVKSMDEFGQDSDEESGQGALRIYLESMIAIILIAKVLLV